MSANLLEVAGLEKRFPVGRRPLWGDSTMLHAVDGVDFSLKSGETLGIVGESGCGKSTLGRLVLRLSEPSGGSITFDGQDITHLPQSSLRGLRAQLQVVFQDPMSSLDPRMTVAEIVAEPLRNMGWSRARQTARVAELLHVTGLPEAASRRTPDAFSGGQRQRIAIARAIAPSPRLIVCDEAVSALDVSIQAQILNLFADLQAQLGMALLFIGHDLAVVRHVSHSIAVMYLGRLVELAPEPALFQRPAHPYTRALLDSAPVPNPRARRQGAALTGELPSPIDRPPGCHFSTRCPRVQPECTQRAPEWRRLPGDDTHHVRCHFPLTEA
jgi:oligopeptide/dipeptide ABC transporter ATP-binding protein